MSSDADWPGARVISMPIMPMESLLAEGPMGIKGVPEFPGCKLATPEIRHADVEWLVKMMGW